MKVHRVQRLIVEASTLGCRDKVGHSFDVSTRRYPAFSRSLHLRHVAAELRDVDDCKCKKKRCFIHTRSDRKRSHT